MIVFAILRGEVRAVGLRATKGDREEDRVQRCEGNERREWG